MLNPFFLQGSNSEQNLVQDLINEQLRMYGGLKFTTYQEDILQKKLL